MWSARRVVVAVLLVVGALAGQGCTPAVSGPVLVLRLASPDPSSYLTGLDVKHFAEQVSQRSGGTIRVEPVWDVTPDGARSWDQTVAKGVARGRWDMGLVPGRAWDELGVRSLRALNAPFLVTSQPAMKAVLDDAGLRRDLLAGLPAAGVTGLDLFPDEMRHPYGYTQPLLGPGDYSGHTVEAARSGTVYRVLDSLGARPTDAFADGSTQRGQESSYSLAAGQIATGNVTFWPKTETLVVRNAVRSHLRPDQWTVLRGAAAQTRSWLFTHLPTDREEAATFCAKGGTIAAATHDQVVALEETTSPVTAALRRDPTTRRLIDAVRARVRGIRGPRSPTSCATKSRTATTDLELHALDGTYVTAVSLRRLLAAGISPNQAAENSGRFTWSLDAGAWVQQQTAHHFVNNPDTSGRYTYRDGRLTFLDDQDAVVLSVLVTVTPADGTLHFRDPHDAAATFQALDEVVFSVPWHRVGGATN